MELKTSTIQNFELTLFLIILPPVLLVIPQIFIANNFKSLDWNSRWIPSYKKDSILSYHCGRFSRNRNYTSFLPTPQASHHWGISPLVFGKRHTEKALVLWKSIHPFCHQRHKRWFFAFTDERVCYDCQKFFFQNRKTLWNSLWDKELQLLIWN